MKFNLLFLLSSETFLLVVGIAQNLNGANIIFDISQLAKDVMKSKPDQNKLDKALDTILKKNDATSLLYYEADFYENITVEIKNVLGLFSEKTSRCPGFMIIFSLRDAHGELVSQNMRLLYTDLLDTLSEHISIVAGLSYYEYYLDSLCDHHSEIFESGHPATSIISDTRKHISEYNKRKNLNLNLNVGYELHVNYLKCKDHKDNIQQADFLIVNVPFNRKDVGFSESYSLFKNVLDNEIMPAMLKSSDAARLFVKVSVTKNVDHDQWKAFYKIGRLPNKPIYDTDQLDLLRFAKNSLENFEQIIYPRYEHLITQYMLQWISDNKDKNYSIILTSTEDFLHVYNSKFKNNATAIPFVTFPPPDQIPDGFYIGVETFIKDLETNGFTTIMVPAETWKLVDKTDFRRNFNYSTATEKSVEVLFYLENINHYESIESKQTTFQETGEVVVRTIVLSNNIYFESKKSYEKWLWNNICTKNTITLACQISADNLKPIGTYDECEKSTYCEAIKIRAETINKCKYFNYKTNTVIWSKYLSFVELEKNQYRLEEFVNSTKQMLESFLIAREIVQKDYPNENIIIHLKGLYSGSLSINRDISMYCNIYAERINQLYNAILTWAQIHEFPIILEPSGEMNRYDHPLVWNRIEVSSENAMHNLTTGIPLYIRRNYITSKTFGWWNNGMYPCIQKATTENTKDIKSNAFQNAGVTLELEIRQTHPNLTPNEFQVLLLFSLYKFTEVLIPITKLDYLSILKDAVHLLEFRENLKLNQITGRIVHLKLSDTVCLKVDKSVLNEIMVGFRKAGLKVKISAESLECLQKLKSEKSEIGLVVDNCMLEAINTYSSNLTKTVTKNFLQVDYIVCVTNVVLAHNRNGKEMQDYLDSHLYLKKFFQYFYPNLKQVYFQLHSKQVDDVNKISDLLMFLTDVNNYAIGYKMNYFLLQAFPKENNNLRESSFWTITNYKNLTNLTVYHDQLSIYLKEETWTPKFFFRNGQEAKNIAVDSTLVSQIAGGIGLIAFCALIIIGIYLFWRKATRLTRKEIYQFRIGRQETLRKAVKERLDNQYTVNIYDGLVFQKEFEISKKFICINRRNILSKGKFTTTHPATLANLEGCIVCAKLANKKCPKQNLMEMMSELKLLTYLGDHMNLVRFIGCYTKEIRKGVLWIVTEFCDGGSLYAYLRAKKEADILELIRFAYGISRGMEYISKQKVIHGNLSTSVVFLDGTKTCKICGYGRLAGKMEELRRQMKRNKAPKEWEWMAYESLKDCEFSIESDVWSFGVTVWEIFSLGEVPYLDVTWDNFIGLIESGMRLQMPELASKEIYDLMIKCWNLNPKDRPHFSFLVERFGDLLGKNSN